MEADRQELPLESLPLNPLVSCVWGREKLIIHPMNRKQNICRECESACP